MRALRVLGVSVVLAVCSTSGSPGWATLGEPACEVYPAGMDPKPGAWAFVTVCEAESPGPPPILRIGARDLALELVNAVKEGSRLAVLWAAQGVVDDPAGAIELVLPGTGTIVPLSRIDAKTGDHVPGKVSVRLRFGSIEFYPIAQSRDQSWRAMPVAISHVHITDPSLATWLRRLGAREIKKTIDWQAESRDDPLTRRYAFHFDERVCPYAVIQILSPLAAIEEIFPPAAFRFLETRVR